SEYYVWNKEERETFAPMAAFVQSRLANDASKNAYALAFQGAPQEIWKHYVASVFSNFQYFQYTSLNPGKVIVSIGIDEGFEIPYFTAFLNGQGQIHAIDPFGTDFLGRYPWQNIGCFPNLLVEHRLAITNYKGTANIPFGGTMVFGGALNQL